MIDRVLSVVAPHLCSGCGKIGTLLCGRCKSHIANDPFRYCLVCKSTTSLGICIEHNKSYEKAWIVGTRSGPLQQLIGGFKFMNVKAAAKDLAKLLDLRLPTLPAHTIVVPVPTAPAHIRERGYDHMALIAKYFASRRGLQCSAVLGRAGVATQHRSNKQERIIQAKTAFTIQAKIAPQTPYLLLDDVVTTGSTIDEASKLLALSGASKVWIGALAYQPLD